MKPAIFAIIITGVLVVAAAGAYLLTAGTDETPAGTPSSNSAPSPQPATNSDETTNETPTFTAKQVAEHDHEDDCWTIIDGSVYDLTSFIPQHPGGDEILRACGEDATTMFMSRTDEDGDPIGSGTPHSSSAMSQLQELKIGELSQ